MEILERLFNHNPSTQGELSYFMQEFDDRIIKDQNALNSIEESSRNMCEETLPSVLTTLSDNLANLTAKVLVCEEMCQRITERNTENIDRLQGGSGVKDFKTSKLEDHELDQMIKQQKDAIMANFEDAVSKLHKEYDEMTVQIERENFSHQI